MTKLNYKSYELAALEPSLPPLFLLLLLLLRPSIRPSVRRTPFRHSVSTHPPLMTYPTWFLSLFRFTFITMSCSLYLHLPRPFPLVLFCVLCPLAASRHAYLGSLFFCRSLPASLAWRRFNMQDANGRQYKREMASFEVGSENASTMAGSVLRDDRASERKREQRG